MRHELKIEQKYLIRIVENEKTFEVRVNDRDYQVDDTIRFLPLECEYNNAYDSVPAIPDYMITYIHSGYGMDMDFVVLGIEEIKR